jgi:hypothetical protein
MTAEEGSERQCLVTCQHFTLADAGEAATLTVLIQSPLVGWTMRKWRPREITFDLENLATNDGSNQEFQSTPHSLRALIC